MPESSNGSQQKGAFSAITPAVVIQVVTIIAVIGGNWYLMKERVDGVSAGLKALETVIYARHDRYEERIRKVETDQAAMAVRLENIREALIELRRQGHLGRGLGQSIDRLEAEPPLQ